MSNIPFQKRSYRAFLSYSHKDSELVERLYDWLERVAKISIWHDEHSLAASSMISTDNLNTCIEAGVALGAGRRLRLVAHGIPHRAPFMLSDYHVHFYNDDAELLGLIYSFVYPYRRRILNADIAQ